jgi:phospholipid N-methyltransferase
MERNTQPLRFLQRFFLHPKTIGAIAPTSKWTAHLMAEPISPSASILEIGAGTGALTREILKRIDHSEQLTLVEIDPELAEILHQNFPFLKVNVEDVERSLQRKISYDAVVSGIPFASMDKQKRLRIFKLIQRQLNPNGLFIAFQYSLYTKRELESIFSKVDIRFSLLNLPPAFIYVCRK